MKLIISTIVFIATIGYVSLTKLIFGEENLVKIDGQLKEQKLFVKLDEISRKKVECSYLTFFMNRDAKLYTLKMIPDSSQNAKYLFYGVARKLTLSGQLAVWIKKEDLKKIAPKVFRIEADGEAIYEIKAKPNNNLLSFSIFMGSVFLCLGLVWLMDRYYDLKEVWRSSIKNLSVKVSSV